MFALQSLLNLVHQIAILFIRTIVLLANRRITIVSIQHMAQLKCGYFNTRNDSAVPKIIIFDRGCEIHSILKTLFYFLRRKPSGEQNFSHLLKAHHICKTIKLICFTIGTLFTIEKSRVHNEILFVKVMTIRGDNIRHLVAFAEPQQSTIN